MSLQSRISSFPNVESFLKELLIFTSRDARLAGMDDYEALQQLTNEDTRLFFGDVNYEAVLDLSHISLCIETSGETIAFLCLNDHPNVPSIPSWEWGHWLYNIYHLELITPRNTLWIHLAVYHPKYVYTFLSPLMESVFERSPFLEYIIAVIPPGIKNINWLENHGTRIIPPGFSKPNKIQTLYLMVRQDYVTKYKIRRAVEEDNDDLVPLIDEYSERLEEHYGKFYVAEMLTRHPDAGRKIIVAEYNENAIALLCLNETLNDAFLNEAFELVPYYGLRKPHPDDELEHTELPQTSASCLHGEEPEEEEGLLTIEESPNECDSRGSGEFEFSESYTDVENIHVAPDDSLDAFSLMDVSSIHLFFESPSEENLPVESRSDTSDDYSAMILSFTEYEMHLFADRTGITSLSFEDLEHHSTKQMKPHSYIQKIPTFHGEINAFTLELAASHPQHEAESLALLLEGAFECFPDRDYCILSIPSTCPPFPFIKNFVRVAPRPVTTYPQELYILHRNAILSKMSVRIAVRSDIGTVELLVANLLKTQSFMGAFIAAVNEEKDYRSYLLLSENQPVGVAILREEHDFEYLKNHYELTQWLHEKHYKTGSHGLLEHHVLSPIFQRHSRFFLREIHRLSDFSALYYCIYPNDIITSLRDRTLCCVLSDLIPIKYRQAPEFTQTNLDNCAPEDVVYRNDAPFALYVSTPRHCSLPRYEINKKIVIVGTSDTAISFLASLICSNSISYYAIFTNVSVVSPHGLPYHKVQNRVRDMMFARRNIFNNRYMNLTSLRTYANVVNAVMTGIDRKNKLLIVNDVNYLSYDLLFLMCGEQFQKPNLTPANKEQQKTKASEFPRNVFLINTETDATNALIKLKDLACGRPKQNYNVIVYGYALEAYCCMASLLEYGVPGANITFVEPFPIVAENKFFHHVSIFNDGEVDEAVQSAILSEEIKTYSSYYFVDWTMDHVSNSITKARFESRHRKININCIAMFMYNNKTVSARTFLAINLAGLVFDGALVVGPDCCTNDRNIYAAGTITKYSRRYYADHLSHKYYNLQEIGYELGQKVRKKLIPHFNEEEDAGPIVCKMGTKLVPIYEKPLMTYCCLPGNLRYLSITKPGKQVPLEVAMGNDDYGQVLVTGDCKQIDKQGYFRLHLNQHGVIETITCLAKFDIDRVNIKSLWGQHEKLLNNLHLRFEMLQITDFYDYFREPWTSAIYHDRFPILQKQIRKLMTSYTLNVGESVLEDLMSMYKENDWAKLTFDQKEELEEKFIGSPYQKQLEELVLDFIRDNDTFLPMYAHPNVVRFLLQGFENSPLFKPQ